MMESKTSNWGRGYKELNVIIKMASDSCGLTSAGFNNRFRQKSKSVSSSVDVSK